MVAGRYINSFRNLCRYWDRRKLAKGIRKVDNILFCDRGGAWNLPNRCFV